MRRLLVLVVVIAAGLLVAAAPAAATQYHPAAAGLPGPGDIRSDVLTARAATGHFVPLGARLSGNATVSGTVYDADHVPGVGVAIQTASSDDGDHWEVAWSETEAGGVYSIPGVPGAVCWIYAYPGTGDPYLGRTDSPWSAGGTYSGRDFYPGHVNVSALRGGPWGDFSQVWFMTWHGTRDCRGILYAEDQSDLPLAVGDIQWLDGTYTEGFATFFWDEGVEFSGTWNVSSGAVCPTELNVSEADAQRVYFNSPIWYSGKPGATVKMVFGNYPAGWVNRVGGWSEDPAGTIDKIYGEHTTPGTATYTRSYKVPGNAVPGYSYWFTVDHINGQGSLYLDERYQVCTMKPSKASVRKGTRIKVSGVVPIQGHWGATKGKAKTVTLYAHKGTAAAPKKWDPRSAGWVKVCSVKTNGLGAYTTPLFKPLKTQTLIVRYPGDEWYYPAYTSTAKVTVK